MRDKTTTEKPKRKVNPRQRILTRLIFSIAVIVALIASGVYLLRPKGAQIVFIAPDDDGIEQIWLANTNPPHYQKQLTHQPGSISYFQTSSTDSILLYAVRNNSGEIIRQEIWLLNLKTNENIHVMTCEEPNWCYYFALHPGGHWLAYQLFAQDEDGTRVFEVHVRNLLTLEDDVIYERRGSFSSYHDPVPQWVGTTHMLVFRINGTDRNIEDEEFAFYSLEENRIIETTPLNAPFWTPIFSDDGSMYAHVVNHMAREQQPTFIRPIDDYNDLVYQTGNFSHLYDWHPDNTGILVSCFYECSEEGYIPGQLYLQNIMTGDSTPLISTDENTRFFSANFNVDGSKILNSRYNSQAEETSLWIYDMETGEELFLPVFGRNPQWVNGGR